MIDEKTEFLEACEEILGKQHAGRTIGFRRWRRGAGSGRFQGCVIRWYSSTCIHIMDSTITKTFQSTQEAFNWLSGPRKS